MSDSQNGEWLFLPMFQNSTVPNYLVKSLHSKDRKQKGKGGKKTLTLSDNRKNKTWEVNGAVVLLVFSVGIRAYVQ